jgi:phage-related protein
VKIELYQTPRKRCPITDYIDKQQTKEQSIILAVLEDIQNEGLNAKGCQFRQIEGKLWEIKIKTPSGGYRLLYVMITKDLIFILHILRRRHKKLR